MSILDEALAEIRRENDPLEQSRGSSLTQALNEIRSEDRYHQLFGQVQPQENNEDWD